MIAKVSVICLLSVILCILTATEGFYSESIRALLEEGFIGSSSRPLSDECAKIMKEIEAAAINEKQKTEGVVGGVLVENDCKILLAADLLAYKTEEQQLAICENSCFGRLASLHLGLLEKKCFDGDGSDEYEASAGKLHAGAYLFACQKDMLELYCVPKMGGVIEAQDDEFDLCQNIVAKWGCCYHNYKMYFEKFGLNASVASLDKISQDCESSIAPDICPCASNDLVGIAESEYRTCAGR